MAPLPIPNAYNWILQPFGASDLLTVVINNGNRRFHAVIKHFCIKQWTAAHIKTEFDAVRETFAPILKTIYF